MTIGSVICSKAKHHLPQQQQSNVVYRIECSCKVDEEPVIYIGETDKVKTFDPEVTDDVTGQVKVRIFDFLGLVTSASKISMLSANKANESAWIVSLTSVSIICYAL